MRKLCPTCKQKLPLTVAQLKQARIKNALATIEKRKQNGTYFKGRDRNYDYDKIIQLRKRGYSVRNVAALVGCSPALVHQVTKPLTENKGE